MAPVRESRVSSVKGASVGKMLGGLPKVGDVVVLVVEDVEDVVNELEVEPRELVLVELSVELLFVEVLV